MTIRTIDEKNFNLTLRLNCNMDTKTVTYEIVAWDKVNHKVDQYLFKDGDFGKACDKFESLKIGMRSIRDDAEFLADLQAEQKEQM